MRTGCFLFILLLWGTAVKAQDTIYIDTTVTYQTIEGWGHGGGILGFVYQAFDLLDTLVSNPVSLQQIDYLVDDLGLTGSRYPETGPRPDGTGMDNGDCDSIDWTKFRAEDLAPGMYNYLAYYKDRILLKGFEPSFYSSPGYPTLATILKPWVMYNPGERAQQIWASALYLKNNYGININYDVIYNEPGGSWDEDLLADDIKALSPRLIAHGLSTKSHYAEALCPQTGWNYIVPVENDTDLWPCVGRLTYHNYSTADPYRTYIRDFGLSRGIITAQTEMDNPTFDDLYKDQTLGGVSYWEIGYSSGRTLVPQSGLTSFTPSTTYFRLRQAIHYVRPGSVRVGASSNDPLLQVLVYKRNGKITVVAENTGSSAKNVVIKNLPPGQYGLSKSPYSATAFQELGINTVGYGGTLTISAGGGSTVNTLYPYAGTNQPPTIMTFYSNPGYLVSPDAGATLISTANDAELNSLTYHWTVTSHPGGADPSIANPYSSSTSVSGLTAPGIYVFTIEVNDGSAISSQKVYLVKYATDPPPVIGICGFRIAAPYGLVFGNTGDTTHANIELPLSTVILQAQISDLESTDFTGMGTWSLVQQPPGANAQVSSTTYIYVSFRATVTGMTVPGDYVFRITVNKPGFSIFTAEIICTVHPASSAPVISSITANPPGLTWPDSTLVLTAITSDPESDLLRHWWKVNSVPAGAHLVFDHQCRPLTSVTGFSIPGDYKFTLRAFDDIHMTTRDFSITVHPYTGTNDDHDTTMVRIYPDPAIKNFIIEAQAQDFGFIITDLYGRKIREQHNCSEKTSVNCEGFDPGIYFIRLTHREEKIFSRKLVISK